METQDIIYCPCGYEIKNGICSRLKPIKACQGWVKNNRVKYAGKSKFYDKNGYAEI